MLWCRRNFLHPGVSQVELRIAGQDMGNPAVMECDPPIANHLAWKAHDLLMVMLLFFHRFQTVIHLAMGNRLPVLCGKNNQNIVQHVAWVFLLHSTWESDGVHIWALV